MSTVVSYNGTNYTVPSYGDTGYAQGPGNLSTYLVSLATGSMAITGNQSISGIKTFTSPIYLPDGSAASPSLTFASDIHTGFYHSTTSEISATLAGTQTYLFGTSSFLPKADNTQALGLNGFRWSVLWVAGIVGTTTNDNAAAGNIGEVQRGFNAGTSATGNNNYFDVTNIVLTAGDWDISAVVSFGLNGATGTAAYGGIGTASGNSATGTVANDNFIGGPFPTGAYGTSVTIPSYRVSIAGSTTYYLKAQMTYSAGTPTAAGRISARRVR